jgi:pilus assembly protein Flp/PilA
MKSFIKFLKQEDGASAAEYGLLVALIAIVIIVGVTTLGTKLNADFTNIASKL